MDFGSPLNLVNVDEPKIENNKYVKIRTRMCGICGTDLSKIDLDKSFSNANTALAKTRRMGPLFLGHEIVGEVVDVGSAVEKFKIGDRISIGDENNCDAFGIETCEFCKRGLPILCVNKHKRKYFGNVYGGWSEYFVRHENQLFLIPDEMNDDLAVLMETASVSLHAVLRSVPNKDDHILIIGGGAIGLGIISALRALRTEPIKITVLARHQFQRNMALKLGADNVVSEKNCYREFSEILQTPLFGAPGNRILNNGFHIIYDCVFNSSTVNDALRWLRPRGNLVAVGINKLPSLVDFTSVGQRELKIIGVHGYAYDSWQGKIQHTIARCIEWANTGRLNISPLLTHKYPLREYKNAIETASSHYTSDISKAEKEKSVKVVFDYSL